MNFTIFVTDLCNLQCKYCYEKNTKNKVAMDNKTMKQTLSFICNQISEKKEKHISIVFHGGEPLLNINAVEFFIVKLRQQSDFNFNFSLTTNGTIFNSQVKNIIKELHDISISIDGTKYSHNLNRIDKYGNGTYTIVQENIKNFLSYKPYATARLTVTKANVYKLYENIMAVIHLGFKCIIANPDIDSDGWSTACTEVYLTSMKKISNKTSVLEGNVELPILSYSKKKKKNGSCDGGKSSFCIAADGRIYPCLAVSKMEQWEIGTVSKGIYPEKIAKLKRISELKVVNCMGCARYDYCKGTICKLVNWKYTGSYNKPLISQCIYENIAFDLGKNSANH